MTPPLFRMIAPVFPALNIYSRIAGTTTALGPLCVATAARRAPPWQVEVIDENNYRRPGPRDANGLPDHELLQVLRPARCVGFYGGLSSTIPRLYALAAHYRASGAVTVAGGHHFVGDTVREALAHGVDYVVLGEGEETIIELLNVLRNGGDTAGIKGLAFLRDGHLIQTPERPPLENLAAWPAPDFSLLRHAHVSLFPVAWSRGCAMACEFCAVKGRPRALPVENVVRQIAHLHETFGARHIFIVDDLFGQLRAETLRLCRLLRDYRKAVGLRLDLTVQIRLDRATDTELLHAMHEAGVATVCIGFESPIAEELAAMDKRTRADDMRRLARRYHEAGFAVHGMFIFGYPLLKGARFELPIDERIRQFKRFIRQSRMDTIQVLLPVPLPGTELTRRLHAAGRIFSRDDIGWEYYDGNFPLFTPDPPLTPETMQRAVMHIMGRFYRFRSCFAFLINLLLFPAMLTIFWDFASAWGRWQRRWRNTRIRFGGWLTIQRWRAQVRRARFGRSLSPAQTTLRVARQ